MMLKNFLFDLDGTLLPMDLKPFIELYLQAFCKRFADPMQLDGTAPSRWGKMTAAV